MRKSKPPVYREYPWWVWALSFVAVACLVLAIRLARAEDNRVNPITFSVSTASSSPGTYVYASATSLRPNTWEICEAQVSYAGASVTGASVILCDRQTVTDSASQCTQKITVDGSDTPVSQTAQHMRYRYQRCKIYKPASGNTNTMTIGLATFGATATGQTVTLYARPLADY